jgi:hypothetical protein
MRRLVLSVPVVMLGCAVAVAVAGPAPGQTALPDRAVTVEGTISMLIEDDFKSGRATRHYFLNAPSYPGGRYDLKLTSRQADSVQPGMRVRVVGRLANGVLTADQADESVVVLDPPGAPSKAR